MNQEPMGVLGVFVGDWTTAGSFDYYIAVSSSQSVPEGMVVYEVPASAWTIFECKEPMPLTLNSTPKATKAARIISAILGCRYKNDFNERLGFI